MVRSGRALASKPHGHLLGSLPLFLISEQLTTSLGEHRPLYRISLKSGAEEADRVVCVGS
jgi:hypothetical protein